jgi:hypothetical protein
LKAKPAGRQNPVAPERPGRRLRAHG